MINQRHVGMLNVNLAAVFSALVLVAAWTRFGMGHVPQDPMDLNVRSLTIVDAKGNPKISLTTSWQGTPIIALLNDSGRATITLGLLNDPNGSEEDEALWGLAVRHGSDSLAVGVAPEGGARADFVSRLGAEEDSDFSAFSISVTDGVSVGGVRTVGEDEYSANLSVSDVLAMIHVGSDTAEQVMEIRRGEAALRAKGPAKQSGYK